MFHAISSFIEQALIFNNEERKTAFTQCNDYIALLYLNAHIYTVISQNTQIAPNSQDFALFLLIFHECTDVLSASTLPHN